tara:strand:+ start:1506 stop:1607 length:102 start_codon:yes stop_codon:yes gene_type:complete
MTHELIKFFLEFKDKENKGEENDSRLEDVKRID